MAEKAAIANIDGISQVDGVFSLGLTFYVTEGTVYRSDTCTVTSTNFNLGSNAWRQRIKAAVIAAALEKGAVVDEVIFPDLQT